MDYRGDAHYHLRWRIGITHRSEERCNADELNRVGRTFSSQNDLQGATFIYVHSLLTTQPFMHALKIRCHWPPCRLLTMACRRSLR